MSHHPPIPPVPTGDRPKWSVMIPTFNCDHHLETALRSVLSQVPIGSQIEVVDDHSTAGDPESVVRQVGGGAVSFHRQPLNVGHTRNFNTCLLRSRGELVHVLHGDDVIEPGFYREMTTLLESWPDAGAAVCRHTIIDDVGVHRSLGPLLRCEPGILDDWLRTIASGQLLQPPSVVVRREIYELIGGFDESVRRYGEDWEMSVRVAAATNVAYLPAPLASYRKQATGTLSDLRHVQANMRDMRHIMRSNRSVLADANVSDWSAVDLAARLSLRDALLRRWRRLQGADRRNVLPIEALRADPTARGAGRVLAAVAGTVAVQFAPSALTLARRSIGRGRSGRTGTHHPPPSDPPPSIAALTRSEAMHPLPTSARSDGHFAYAVGSDQVLHLYSPPASAIRRSIPERRSIDQLGVVGVPRLRASADADGWLWVLEDRVAGAGPGGPDLTSRVYSLLVEVAGPPGPPLAETAYWRDTRPEAIAAAGAFGRVVADAWESLSPVPARVVHGDVRPENVIRTATGAGLIGWEGARRHGLPGVDVLSWWLTSGGDVEHQGPALLRRLTAGFDPAGAALQEVGVPGSLMHPAVLTMLSVLVLLERGRAERWVRHDHTPTPFRALLDEWQRSSPS